MPAGNDSGSHAGACILCTDAASLLLVFCHQRATESSARQLGGPWLPVSASYWFGGHQPSAQRYRVVLKGDRHCLRSGRFIKVWKPGWQGRLQDDSKPVGLTVGMPGRDKPSPGVQQQGCSRWDGGSRRGWGRPYLQVQEQLLQQQLAGFLLCPV